MDINSSFQKTPINNTLRDRPADFRAELPLAKGNRQSEPMGNKELDLAIKKLNYNLSSDKALREDMPRGFYLNVRI
tara:strand:+ start:393 stop:620 length:228 start_codon:yes stop_codon:yes gene_type:complete